MAHNFKSGSTAKMSFVVPFFGEKNVSIFSDFFLSLQTTAKANSLKGHSGADKATVIFHLLQNIFQTDTGVTGCTPQLLHLRQQGPIFCQDAGKFNPCSGRKLEI